MLRHQTSFLTFKLSIALSLLWCVTNVQAGSADYPLNIDPTHIVSGDINGDGKPDLVVAGGAAADVITILQNDAAGSGAFTAQPNIAVTNPNFVALADFNGDGHLDIVTGNSTAASTTIRVILQNALGGFGGATVTPVTVGTLPLTLVVGDFNGDGKKDIAVANNGSNSISVLIGTGTGTFAAAVNYSLTGAPTWIESGDFNSDGKTDLIVAIAGGNRVSMLFGVGDGTFGTPINIATGTTPKFVNVADFNNDGKLDFGVLLSPSATNNTISIFLGNGDGTFQNVSNNPVFPYSGGAPSIVNPNFAIADVTRDGKLDLVFVTDIGTGVPSIFGLKGNGDGTFQTATDFQFSVPGVGMFSIAADLNGDGQPDVATALDNPGTDGVRVELLNPRATLSTLSPTQAVVGATGFTLTVNGTGFINGATVQWNGVNRTTTFGSSTQLTATIPASDLLTAGKATVTVVNPAPGGFASDALFFSVYPTTIGTFTVLNTNDSGSGSLRFALQQARNGDTINFDPNVFDLTNSDAATVINVLSELPAMDDGSVTVDAQNQRVTVNGSGAGSASGLVITSSSNKVMGLAIVGFSKSGISISGGAQSNTIGGPRSTGTGPNGQGLRISNCGAFGIEISGTGTNSNVIKGCWIGLDASGTTAQPNLAGILVQGGAQSNIVGGTADGEANAISGNSFEGITFSGAGTDNNVVLGNVVGAAAVATASRSVGSRESIGGRTAAGNGSAGVFLSKGTQGSQVGGTNTGEGNIVGNNGGNGVEVRAATSKKNSSRANKISKNVKGGIALFDGSNNGVTAPSATEVTVLSTPAPGTQRLKVKGSAARDGTVELFNDSGAQGEFPLGRATVTGGAFEIDVDSQLALKLNATLTDTDGNTSAFSAFSTASADSDGDGVSDTLEDLVGTDKNNSSDAPADGGVLAVDKAQAGVSFSSTGKDSIKLTMLFFLPDNFVNTGSTISVMFGSVTKSFTLNDKGQSPKGLAAVSLKGGSILPQPSKIGVLTFSAKGDLRTGLVASGLTDKTTAKTGDTIKVPVAIGIITGTSKFTYSGQVTLTYKATQGKGGKAAKAK